MPRSPCWTFKKNHRQYCEDRLHHCSYCHQDVRSILHHRCKLMVALGVPFKTKRPDEKCA
jgi:hypothetical protein